MLILGVSARQAPLDSILRYRVYAGNRELMSMKIGEVADRGGVNLQTIRYYEREGLLPQPPRLPSGYRVYTQPTVRRVRFIKRAQELGFTLSQIRELLSLRLDHERERSEVRAIAEAKVADIAEKIRTLTARKDAP